MPRKNDIPDLKQLEIILPHLIRHNHEHAKEMRTWVVKARRSGAVGAATELAKAAALMRNINGKLQKAMRKLPKGM